RHARRDRADVAAPRRRDRLRARLAASQFPHPSDGGSDALHAALCRQSHATLRQSTGADVIRLATLLVAALAVLSNAAAAQIPSLVTVRCASNAADDVTPVLYAQRSGLFAKAGLNVELTRMNSGAAVSAAVLGGSIDIGKSSLLPIITAHSRGLPLVLLAPGELWL